MKREYRQENIQLRDFWRPPTEAEHETISELMLNLEQQINAEANLLAAAHHPPFPEGVRLRIGTEVELHVFDKAFDPRHHHPEDRWKGEGVWMDGYTRLPAHADNPNYTPQHRDALNTLAQRMRLPLTQGGCAELLQEHEPVNHETVFLELRTRPADVNGYTEQLEGLGPWLRHTAGDLGLLPVVHSQHLHVSLTDASGVHNLLREPAVRASVAKGIVDMYRRAYALLRLPEEVRAPELGEIGYSYAGAVRRNGGYTPDNPLRLEARLASSEYLFDPYLTLYLHLLGILRGLRCVGNPHELDAESSLTTDTSYAFAERVSFPTHSCRSYQTAAKQLQRDVVLRQMIPPDLLQRLSSRARRFGDIAAGRRSIAAVRDAALRTRASRLESSPVTAVRQRIHRVLHRNPAPAL